jgi:DNA-binding HxlR family transcriptional regulator
MFELPDDADQIAANVFSETCPARYLLTIISGKWSMLVIDALQHKNMRNGELMRLIEGISQKMLTQTLRDLEKLKLVARLDMQTVPPHVEYKLTALGKSLCKKVCAMDRWVEKNMMEIILENEGFDITYKKLSPLN